MVKSTKGKAAAIGATIMGTLLLTIFIDLMNVSAGDLEPTDPPGPTMKTLEEVEPRIPIHALDLPLVITESGSYYLTESINFTGKESHGILITVSDVTIDLNGFKLDGPGKLSGGNWSGIYNSLSYIHRVTVVNGTVRDWPGHGIYLGGRNNNIRNVTSATNGGNAIYVGDASTVSVCTAYNSAEDGIHAGVGGTIENCTTHGNVYKGIETGISSTIEGCTSYENGSYGIDVGYASVISDCTARDNYTGIQANHSSSISRCVAVDNTSYGVLLDYNSTITGCTAKGNGSDGIKVNHNSVVSACSAYGNGADGISTGEASTIVDCTATENDFSGIKTGQGTSVNGCTVKLNDADGIHVTGGNCRVVGNLCTSNGSGTGAGIYVSGNLNHIEGNTATDNIRGIDVAVNANIIIKNVAANNTGTGSPSANYNIVGGNHYGQIISSPGPGFANVNSWANIQF